MISPNESSDSRAPRFLEMVARDLLSKTNYDLSRTALVFPNKRASLFFNESIASASDIPIWTPAYFTISDLLLQHSHLKKGDPIKLVCELFKVFKQATQSTETLDDFYFWGELLISDFDDVDKNLVDAHRLFSNLQELKRLMDDYDFLNEEQVEAIKQFFQNFSIEKQTALKQKFISLWDKLDEIYTLFRANLEQQGIAYEGMIYREVVENWQADAFDKYDRYVFVGFNVLNEVEKRFFQTLQAAGKAMFYWDYDVFYTRLPREQRPPYVHEAGEFILRNLDDFPNELPEHCFDVLRKPKRVRFISSPTENAQARYITGWVKERDCTAPIDWKETAVVLCNESLLMPVLHAIPQEVEHVNITMGFPLAQTPVYSFMNVILTLQTEGYDSKTGRYTYKAVMSVLKHPYTRQLSPHTEEIERELTRNNRFYPLPSELQRDEYLTHLFGTHTGNQALCRYVCEQLQYVSGLYRQADKEESEELFNQLYRESLFKGYTLVNRLLHLIETGDLEGVTTRTLKQLLARLLTQASIPFHGEPAIGMQVMGVLETRNLDFKHLAILSLNEGKLPKSDSDSSFVPYNLRKAFGMTTVEHKNAVYAYYFYRLIERAEDLTLLYNTSSDGLNRGEMSRFMLQFLVEWPGEVEQYYLDAGQQPLASRVLKVEKNERILTQLYNQYDVERYPERILSPSALNAYLDCRMKFYFRYVKHLKAPDEVTSEIDSALFGTIFHYAAELLYRDLMAHGSLIDKHTLELLLKDEIRLQKYVDLAFKKHLFHVEPHEYPEYNGLQLINSKVILSYLKQLLKNDLRCAPFQMVDMEKEVDEIWRIDTPLGALNLKIGGTIDRMDSKDGVLRIVDYKTGGVPRTPEDVAQLFTPDANRPGYIFQAFLYAAIMCRRQPLQVSPALLYIHKAAQDSYSPVIQIGPARNKMPVDNFAFFEDEFRERLSLLLQEIFGYDEPFVQTEDKEKCQYCDFKRLCRR